MADPSYGSERLGIYGATLFRRAETTLHENLHIRIGKNNRIVRLVKTNYRIVTFNCIRITGNAKINKKIICIRLG